MGITSSHKLESYKVKSKILKSFLIIVVFAVLGFLLISHPSKILSVDIGGQKIKVDLAVTSAEKKQGLSGRAGLAEDTGMLFIFDRPGKYPFWMKDMNFPIDIIWISRDKKIVFIEKNAMPNSYPNLLGGQAESSYVLEVVSGFAEKYGLRVGDDVGFTY
jgi:uncharacterized membrane protein (UPF0127 family)